MNAEMPFSRRRFLSCSALAAASFFSPTSFALPIAQAEHAPANLQPAGLPRMTVTDFTKRFDPAYLSNGLIGIRPGPNPLSQAPTAVSGFVYSQIPYEVQALSPAPYPLETNIEIDRVNLVDRPDLMAVQSQSLDMQSGELVTRMKFSPGNGEAIAIEVLQFACRSTPSLLCQELSLTASAKLQAVITARIGVRGVPGNVYRDQPPPQTAIDLVMGFRSHGSLSKLGVALMIEIPPEIHRGAFQANDEGIGRRYELAADAGQVYRFRTVAAMISDFYHPEPELEAIRLASWGATLGFDVLRAENRDRWEELWKSRVRLTGPADDQKVLDSSFFYLHSSLNPSDMTGMPPYGLSQTRAYNGHSFWDTETWSLLPVMMGSPRTARALLEFRRRSLGAAKKLAALFGYRGAQFPWEAAPVGGFGVTPTYAATGWEEQHITPDVALGFWEYQLGAGDAGFLKSATWPVLRAVANWIVSRGIYTRRGFEIHHIMGPDEGLPNVNNDAYVNLICKMVLHAAAECAIKAGETPVSAWQRAAKSMYLPLDRSRNIMLPCDNPPQGKNYPIGGIDMLTVHDPPVSRELLRNTFNYEETFRSRRAPSIGFSEAAVAATAAFLGYRDRAAKLFDQSWRADWMEPFGMIKEVPGNTFGCFLTTCGSLLQTVMLGFTGLRVREGDWRAYPACLPQGWSRIEIDRIWVRGEPKHLTAANGKLARWAD